MFSIVMSPLTLPGSAALGSVDELVFYPAVKESLTYFPLGDSSQSSLLCFLIFLKRVVRVYLHFSPEASSASTSSSVQESVGLWRT